MKTYKVIVSLIVLVTIVSCNKSYHTKEKQEQKRISLTSKGGTTSKFKEGRSFQFIDTIRFKDFKGVIDNDSSFVTFVNLHKNNNAQPTSNKTRLYCLSGFSKGKQYYIVDENFNKDFSDDTRVEFNKEMSKQIFYNSKLKDTFKLLKIELNKQYHQKKYKDTLYLKIFPDIISRRLNKGTPFQKFQHTLSLVGETSNYLIGEFSFANSETFKVIMDNNSEDGNLVFSKKTSTSRTTRTDYYSIKDTINLGNTSYIIQEVDKALPALFLKKLKKQKSVQGFRLGETTKNFKIENLEGSLSMIKNQFKGKEFIFIDFWGTWCGPCKELTPDIKKLHVTYKNKVNFISLAYEKDPEPVKEYVQKNNMHWYQGIIKGNPKKTSSSQSSSNIIKNLKIDCFPTFIILNQNLEIVYRDCGGYALPELEMFLKKIN